jgi:hypothetical protein
MSEDSGSEVDKTSTETKSFVCATNLALFLNTFTSDKLNVFRHSRAPKYHMEYCTSISYSDWRDDIKHIKYCDVKTCQNE